MNKLEEILFYEATCRQLGKLDTNNKILKTYQALSKTEKERYHQLHGELHEVWNYINSGIIQGAKVDTADSLEEFHNRISPLSPEIYNLISLGITLKQEVSQELKDAIKQITGNDYDDFASQFFDS